MIYTGLIERVQDARHLLRSQGLVVTYKVANTMADAEDALVALRTQAIQQASSRGNVALALHLIALFTLIYMSAADGAPTASGKLLVVGLVVAGIAALFEWNVARRIVKAMTAPE